MQTERIHNVSEIIDKNSLSTKTPGKTILKYGKKIKMRTLKIKGTVIKI